MQASFPCEVLPLWSHSLQRASICNLPDTVAGLTVCNLVASKNKPTFIMTCLRSGYNSYRDLIHISIYKFISPSSPYTAALPTLALHCWVICKSKSHSVEKDGPPHAERPGIPAHSCCPSVTMNGTQGGSLAAKMSQFGFSKPTVPTNGRRPVFKQ